MNPSNQKNDTNTASPSPNSHEPAPQEELSPEEVRHWIEFGCWTALVLSPFLYWVNGPAVSTDQFVVRTAMVVIATTGAIGLRAYALWRKKKSR